MYYFLLWLVLYIMNKKTKKQKKKLGLAMCSKQCQSNTSQFKVLLSCWIWISSNNLKTEKLVETDDWCLKLFQGTQELDKQIKILHLAAYHQNLLQLFQITIMKRAQRTKYFFPSQGSHRLSQKKIFKWLRFMESWYNIDIKMNIQNHVKFS